MRSLKLQQRPRRQCMMKSLQWESPDVPPSASGLSMRWIAGGPSTPPLSATLLAASDTACEPVTFTPGFSAAFCSARISAAFGQPPSASRPSACTADEGVHQALPHGV